MGRKSIFKTLLNNITTSIGYKIKKINILNTSVEFKTKITTAFLLFCYSTLFNLIKNLLLLLDAGNRGKEPSNPCHCFFKKEITLKTTLKLEKYRIKENDIKVVYTVKSGVVTELKDRPKKANFIDAYLFVSVVHCNSVKIQFPATKKLL